MPSSDIVFFVGLLTWITGVVHGGFLKTPSNTCVKYGSSAVLECSLDDNLLQHWKNPNGDTIAENDRVAEGYHDKIRIEGEYDLVLLNSTFMDAGTYQCIDSTAADSPSQAEVVVIETSQRVHTNNSGNLLLEGEAVELSCDLRYAGNIKPALVWTDSGQALSSIPANQPGLLQSSIVVSGIPHNNGREFTCSVSSEEFPDVCIEGGVSKRVAVHYKPRNTNITKKDGQKLSNNDDILVNDVLVCTSNSYPSVSSYTWRELSSSDVVGNEQDLTVTTEYEGLTGFECLVNNYIGNEGTVKGTDSVEIYLNVKRQGNEAEISDEVEDKEDGGKDETDDIESTHDHGYSVATIVGIVAGSTVGIGIIVAVVVITNKRSFEETQSATNSSGQKLEVTRRRKGLGCPNFGSSARKEGNQHKGLPIGY